MNKQAVIDALPIGTKFKIQPIYKRQIFRVVEICEKWILAVDTKDVRKQPDLACFPYEGLCEYLALGELEIVK